MSKEAERIFRRAERGQGSLRGAVGLGASAHRSRLHQRGQFVHRLSEVRVECGLRAEILDRCFKGGDLRRGSSVAERKLAFSASSAWWLARRSKMSLLAFHAAPIPISTGRARMTPEEISTVEATALLGARRPSCGRPQ